MAQTNKLAYSVTETAEVLGISRPTCYTLLNRSDFPSFKVGSRTLIPVEGLRDWIQQQTQQTGERDGV